MLGSCFAGQDGGRDGAPDAGGGESELPAGAIAVSSPRLMLVTSSDVRILRSGSPGVVSGISDKLGTSALSVTSGWKEEREGEDKDRLSAQAQPRTDCTCKRSIIPHTISLSRRQQSCPPASSSSS